MQLADSVSSAWRPPAAVWRSAPHKVFLEELLRPLRWAERIRRTLPGQQGWHGRWPPGHQFVVGGADETIWNCFPPPPTFGQLHLARVYFPASNPSLIRPSKIAHLKIPGEFRLYQASFLLRDYG